MAIGLSTDERFQRHQPPEAHPECPARLAAIERALAAIDMGDAVTQIAARPASRAELERVHAPEFLDQLERLTSVGRGALDPDTWFSPGSWDAALHAAGASCAAAEAVAAGEIESAFVFPRPPGHHATRDRAMGFCLLNNVAVAAAALVDRGARVAIFDWDVHHGNGTEAIFDTDPRVLYVSTHEWPQYPGTGPADYRGRGAGTGFTLNLPLPAGTNDAQYQTVLDGAVLPAIAAFAPDVILVSAGFDAHRDDPIGGLELTESAYVAATRGLRHIQPRLVLVLEGGYDLQATARSCATVARTLISG